MKKFITHPFDFAWGITILFFLLGFVHITFSLLGLICMGLPFLLLSITKEKRWCKRYCPRASLFVNVIAKYSLKRRIPKVLTKQRTKQIVLLYFGFNLFISIMSTIMVSLGRIEPIEMLRFLIVFPISWDLPQLLNVLVPDHLLHLSYRIYSMMMTTTIIGLVFGLLYMPRTWCVICPIQTLTTVKRKDS